MPANFDDFVDFIQKRFNFLAAEECAAIQDFINILESQADRNTETVSRLLIRFLSDHETIDNQFEAFTVDRNRKLSLKNVKIKPEEFSDQLRNATKSPLPSTSPNESSQSHN